MKTWKSNFIPILSQINSNCFKNKQSFTTSTKWIHTLTIKYTCIFKRIDLHHNFVDCSSLKRGRGCRRRVSSEHQLRFTRLVRIFREFDRKTRELSAGEYLSSVSPEILRTFLFDICEGKISMRKSYERLWESKHGKNDKWLYKIGPRTKLFCLCHIFYSFFFFFFYFFHSFTFSISFWFLKWLNQASSSRNKISKYQFYWISTVRGYRTTYVTAVPEHSFNPKSKYDSHQVVLKSNSWNFFINFIKYLEKYFVLELLWCIYSYFDD